MMQLLLTRPYADSVALAVFLKTHNIQSIISPVMHIERSGTPLDIAGYDGIIVTSRHALTSIKDAKLPCYVVGEHTAHMAHNQGLRVAAWAQTAQYLDRLLPLDLVYLYPCAAHIRHEFTPNVRRKVVYTAIAAESLSNEAIKSIQDNAISGIALYSPRSAEILCALIEQHELQAFTPNISLYCISEAVAQNARKLIWKSLHIATAPDNVAMQELLILSK
ncbi:MAG: uroporphyrinogen-III synthase [Alphaproteobacteria bacterium]|nr:uroporphyrinogen-III synthase [Alphaproteobacteria bacterium]